MTDPYKDFEKRLAHDLHQMEIEEDIRQAEIENLETETQLALHRLDIALKLANAKNRAMHKEIKQLKGLIKDMFNHNMKEES